MIETPYPYCSSIRTVESGVLARLPVEHLSRLTETPRASKKDDPARKSHDRIAVSGMA